MSAAHQEQIARDRTNGLLKAGIGRGYHRRKLAELGAQGDQLSAWVNGDGLREVRDQGKGWTITGPGAASYDTTILLARGLFVKGVAVRVVPLRKLLAHLEHQTEALEDIEAAECLVITDFVQDYAGGILPLTGWQIMMGEEFLGSRLDNNGSVCLHAVRPLAPESGWWSRNLLQRVARKNHGMQVAGE